MLELSPAEVRLILLFRTLSEPHQDSVTILADRLADLTDPQRLALQQHLLTPSRAH